MDVSNGSTEYVLERLEDLVEVDDLSGGERLAVGGETDWVFEELIDGAAVISSAEKKLSAGFRAVVATAAVFVFFRCVLLG